MVPPLGLRPRTLAACVVAAALAGCSGSTTDTKTGSTDSTGTTSGTPTVAVVTVTPPSLALNVGASGTLAAQATSATGAVITGKTATWTSSNSSVAAVSAGVVLGLAAGNALITATIDGISAVATVTVIGTVATPPQESFAAIVAGASHTCALSASGQAFCWGNNVDGELGDGTTTARSRPVAVSGGITFSSISAGSFYTCGIATSPQGAVYCWGLNANGQLGDGTTGTRLVPTAVKTSGPYTTVSAGTAITCGVAATGLAYCWGAAPYLGNNTTNPSTSPTTVSNPAAGVPLTYTSVSVGQNHGCGMTTARQAYCWGGDPNGVLGDGDAQDTTVLIPVQLSLVPTTFKALSAAYNGGCAISTDSTTYCWGQQFPQSATPAVPARLPGGLFFSSLGVGPTGAHGCALTAAGAAYCWGPNSNGQVGDNGSPSLRTAPSLVAGGLTWMSIAAGGTHTCGLTTTGLAYCWGNNSDGQLGNDNTTAFAPTPVLRPQ